MDHQRLHRHLSEYLQHIGGYENRFQSVGTPSVSDVRRLWKEAWPEAGTIPIAKFLSGPDVHRRKVRCEIRRGYKEHLPHKFEYSERDDSRGFYGLLQEAGEQKEHSLPVRAVRWSFRTGGHLH